MTILHVSAECYPAAKVGGMGDVVGALPKYLNARGATAMVVMPWYQNEFFTTHSFETVYSGRFRMHATHSYQVLRLQNSKLGFDLHAVRIPGLLEQPDPYGYDNDADRFIAFQTAVAGWLNTWKTLPDVVHCHDHHTGLLPFFFAHAFAFNRLMHLPTVFTVHNGSYQGWINWEKDYLLPAYDHQHRGLLEWSHAINSLAAAIKCCWRFTTVSPSYLEELWNEPVLGKLFRDEAAKGQGILNGIDDEVWNPQTDPLLKARYDEESVAEGKRINKEYVCGQFQLSADKPLVVFIGRLVAEKGADLLADSFYRMTRETDGGFSFLVLGSGLPDQERGLRELHAALPGQFNCYIGYNEALSHLLYGAADFLLMPSRTEPCGLNQLYALRYGTIPIVRSVGGLKDTVIDFGDPGGFGIRFEQPSVDDICHSLRRARQLYAQTARLEALRPYMMKFDHSWNEAAGNYLALYRTLGGI
ncbi:MAG: glycogen/starch synthase [Chitinophagales bacterium]|nr:glycogen synthase [Chitinophagales bacterium]MDW8393275.1 glycogen/starch synthase [Chitinophagales bacterium]